MAFRRDQDCSLWEAIFPLAILAFLFAAYGLWGYFVPIAAPATANMALVGNLDANTPPGNSIVVAIQVFDHQGRPHELSLVFTKLAAPHTWNLAGFIYASEGRMIRNRVAGITFSKDGAFAAVSHPPAAMTFHIAGLPAPQTVTFGLDGLTQLPEGAAPLRKPTALAMAPGAPIY